MTIWVRLLGATMRACMLLLGLLALSEPANAACTSPQGVAGDMTYSTNNNVMVFCNGNQWISMAGATAVGVSDPRIGSISPNGWCKGNGGGTGLDCTAADPSVAPAGNSGDVQFNNAGALAADTGNFTYASGLLKTPNISATTITATGHGSFGTLAAGGLTVTGQSSLTTISTSLIQVGDNGTSCTSGLSGGVRYNSINNTVDYCTGSAWLSLGPSATVVPAVSTRMTGAGGQTVTANTLTKIAFDTTLFDTANNWNAGSSRFTPNIPGKYIVIIGLGCNSSSNCQVHIVKNGNSYQRALDFDTTVSNRSAVVSTIVDMNGTTDYIEAWGYTNGTVFNGSSVDTYLSAALLTMSGSGGGGGTANPAGTTNDVQFNNAGALAVDTGNFTYASGLLKAPNISATAIAATGAGTFGTIKATGLATLGSALVNGGMTVTGQASITTVSTSLIQVGSNGAACTSGLAGGMRYSTISNTMEYCTGSGWMSMGPSATVSVAFMVSRNGVDQSIPNALDTKIDWTSKNFDTNSNFDLASDRFTPKIPGYYLLSLRLVFNNTTDALTYGFIRKNGVVIASSLATRSYGTHAVTVIAYANGSTDYFDAYGYQSTGGAANLGGTETFTYFTGSILGPQGGGSGGGTANPAGSTNDVQFNSSGALAADTGNFTYASGVLRTPTIGTGALTVSGQSSLTTISTSLIHVGSNGVNCTAGLVGSIRYNAVSSTLQVCTNNMWTSLSSNTTAGGGGSPAGNTGDIQFNTAGTFDADTGKLYWDKTNDRLGIGTSSPQSALHVSGTVTLSGLQAHGTTTGDNFINVVGANTNTNQWLRFRQSGSAPAGLSGVVYSSYDQSHYFMENTTSHLIISFLDENTTSPSRSLAVERMRITKGGSIGIGTALPYSSLTVVNGEVQTSTSGNACNSAQNAGAIRYSAGSLSYCNGSNTWVALSTSAGITALTGEVTASGSGSVAATIANSAVTNAKMANMAANTVKGNNTGSAAAPVDMTMAQLRAILGSGTPGAGNFLRGDGTWAAAGTVNGTGAANHVAYWTGTDTIAHDASQLYWDATNNRLGIGTASPGYPLEVAGDIHASGWLRTTGATGWYSQSYGGGWYMTDATYIRNYGTKSVLLNNDLYMGNATSNTVYFGTAGVAAPGANSIGQKIQLYGTAGTVAASDYAIGIESSNVWFNSGGGFKWYTSSSNKMILDTSGNLTATAFLYSSDKRLKSDITELTGGLAKLDALNPVSFRFTADPSKTIHLGLIAQDVQKVYPEAVKEDDKGYLKLDYPALIGPMVGMLKELKADNDNLKAANDNLKITNEILSKRVNAIEQRLNGLRK